MRIGAGEYRGRELKTPKGPATRPTSGMVRETLFNILAPLLSGAHLLDLYAGCGSVGLEAISRGAAQAVLVEHAHAALACLRQNILALAAAEQTEVLPLLVERALDQLAAQARQFEIIFLDPPFADTGSYQTVFTKVAATSLLAPGGLLVAQHDARTTLPEEAGPLYRSRLKRIGDNALSFFVRRKA